MNSSVSTTTSIRQRLSRRDVLRGAGVCIALPLLNAMMPRNAKAAAKVQPPSRLAVFSVPFGMVENKFHPGDAGFDYKLSETLQPLATLRGKFTTFSNLDHDVRGIHFYTLNRSDATKQVFETLGAKDSTILR